MYVIERDTYMHMSYSLVSSFCKCCVCEKYSQHVPVPEDVQDLPLGPSRDTIAITITNIILV